MARRLIDVPQVLDDLRVQRAALLSVSSIRRFVGNGMNFRSVLIVDSRTTDFVFLMDPGTLIWLGSDGHSAATTRNGLHVTRVLGVLTPKQTLLEKDRT